LEVKGQGVQAANEVEIRAIEVGGEIVMLPEGQDGEELGKTLFNQLLQTHSLKHISHPQYTHAACSCLPPIMPCSELE